MPKNKKQEVLDINVDSDFPQTAADKDQNKTKPKLDTA